MAVRCDAELPAAAIFRTFDPSRNSSLSRTISIAQPVEKLKTSTSAWMNTLGLRYAEFHWQGGYSAFSVSESIAPKVREYIRGQREHHRARSFLDELRALLKEHGVAFDERYVCD